MVAVADELFHAYLNIILLTVLTAASFNGSLCFLRRDSLNHVHLFTGVTVSGIVFCHCSYLWCLFKFCVHFLDMPILHSLLSFHLTHSLGLGVFSWFVFLLELFNSCVINVSDLCTLVHLEYGLAFELINITEQHLLCDLREYCWLCNVVTTMMNLFLSVSHFQDPRCKIESEKSRQNPDYVSAKWMNK